jgi:hypothetical protein
MAWPELLLISCGAAALLLTLGGVFAILPAAMRVARHAREMRRSPFFTYQAEMRAFQVRLTSDLGRLPSLIERARTAIERINKGLRALGTIASALRLLAGR